MGKKEFVMALARGARGKDAVKALILPSFVGAAQSSWGKETLSLTAFAAPTLKTVTKKSKVTSCEVSFSPSQDLHGYDSPWPAGGGKNLVDYLSCVGVGARNGTDSIYGDNTSVSENVLTITQTYVNNGGILKGIQHPSIPADTTFMLSMEVKSSEGKLTYGYGKYAGGGTNQIINGLEITANTWITITREFTSQGDDVGLFIQPFSSGTLEVRNLQLEIGSTATAYAPYSNICPISGWQGAEVTVTGENLLPMPITSGSYANTMTVSVNDDKSFYVTKTSSSGWTTFDLCTNYYLPSGTYMFIHSDDGSQNCSCDIINADTNISITNTRYVKTRTITLTEGTNITVKYARSAIADNVLTKLMMFVGTTATASDYVPYRAPSTSSVTFGRQGKNLIDFSVNDHYGITTTKQNGKAVIAGTASGGTAYPVDVVPITLLAGTYVWSIDGLKTGMSASYSKNGAWAGFITQGATITLTESATIGGYVSVPNGTATDTTISIMLESGSTASAFEPYRDYILGGTADVVLGTGSNTWTSNGSYSIVSVGTSSQGVAYAKLTSTNAKNNGVVIAECYKNTNDAATNNACRLVGGALYVYDNRFTDLATATSLLSGVVFYYEVDTTTPYTFPPASSELILQKGDNNAWAEMKST